MELLPELMTAREVAAVLRVNVTTVSRWARVHRVNAIKLPGGTLRFRRADIEALTTPAQQS